jgi:quinol-cytochrome oxidoreductase complex cytochrome b subunit
MFQSLKYIPAKVGPFDGEVLGVLGFSLAGLFLLLVPFLDKRSALGEPSPLFRSIGIGIIAYIVIFTFLGYFAPAVK